MTHAAISPARGLIAGDPGGERARRERAAFGELASALAEEQDLDSIFHLIVNALSGLTGAERCSLHLLDHETGLLHGQAAHASIDIDGRVKQLVSGMPGDDFTKEILKTRAPVMLTNTLVDPRPVRAAMRRWRARSVLGVPMLLRGEVIGILCLDTEDTATEFSQADQELAVSLSEFGATAINQVQLTSRLRQSLRTQTRQLEMLQRARRMEGQLADILLGGWGVREVVEAMARHLSKPCCIADVDLRCLSYSDVPERGSRRHSDTIELSRHPLAATLLPGIEAGRVQILEAAPEVGLAERLLVAPMDLSGERLGYVVVAEFGGRLGSLDQVIARRAAHNVALQRSRTRLEGELEWHLVESFAASLVRGDREESEALAKSLGVDLGDRRVVCVVAARDETGAVPVTPQQLAQSLTDRDSPAATLAARVGEEVAVILTVPGELDAAGARDWVRARVESALATLSPGGELCAAISSAGRGAGHDQRAYREAMQVVRCIHEHLSDAAPGVVSVDELGAARLMLASSTHKDALQFVRDALGSLAEDRSVKSEELLVTLESFVRLGRGVRDCAQELDVHPNTVRYRLGTIERLTGLLVTTDDQDYLTAQVAMAVVRLSGQLVARRAPAESV